MKTFEEWLERKPAGRKAKKPLKRTRVNKISAKHDKGLREYYRRRLAYLGRNPWCEAGPVITRAKLPRSYRVPACSVNAVQVHHTRGRGPYLNDESTWCGSCPQCHEWIHSHGQKSRELGLLF